MVVTATKVPLNPKMNKHCTMIGPATSKLPMCTKEMLIDALEYNDYLDDVKHFLGVNEPYLHITANQTA